MSKLMMRGGYGEHGRSCFLVEIEQGKRMYMVDCGIMDTDPNPYPNVTAEELEKTDYIFLTHCHKDHSGAFEYFVKTGFQGTLVTTRMTYDLAGLSYEKTEFLELSDQECGNKNVRQFGSLTICYGRTGHCPGGLWFEISEEETILFSGDYQEDTLVYRCDPIRRRKAKIALIDCAHRETKLNAKELRAQIVWVISEKIQHGQRVILPVPQFGRGLELLILMQRAFPNLRICVDRDFADYAKRMVEERVWYLKEAYEMINVDELAVIDIFGIRMPEYDYDILLLADTHLKKQKNEEFVYHQMENGAAILINGRVKENGPVEKLLKEGKAEKLLFPHHQSYGDLKRMAESNYFDMILPFHNHEKEILI